MTTCQTSIDFLERLLNTWIWVGAEQAWNKNVQLKVWAIYIKHRAHTFGGRPPIEHTPCEIDCVEDARCIFLFFYIESRFA